MKEEEEEEKRKKDMGRNLGHVWHILCVCAVVVGLVVYWRPAAS